MSGIAKAGMFMLIYLFIVLVCYFAFSAFMDEMFNVFDELEDAETEAYYDVYIPNMKTAWNMFFAFLAAIPVTWFIFWVFHREPDWSYRRRF